ncbi:MAG: hypothetical protein K6B70_07035 [Clostridia bacterium]|nr:hypothetical protein [Clostridia bacterium]
MELVKDIYFNTDKLVENSDVKVSYTGKFYQGENEKVFLHYGYGKDWNNVKEVEMKKTDLGYQAELNLDGSESINFCFKNQNNEWDNNFGQNYIFNIEKPEIEQQQSQEQRTLVFLGKNFRQPDLLAAGLEDNPINDTIETIQCTEIPQSELQQEEQKQEQALTLAPTGFIYWTQKVRETVCRFFSAIPKLISGNYKRNIANNK